MPGKTLYTIKASAGTGKTYTLAAHYVALLMNDVLYRRILAVTFTNKATAEMKQRIITYLNAIATASLSDDDPTRVKSDKVHDFLDCVRQVSAQRGYPARPDSEYKDRAARILPRILSDFDNMRILTIDAFLQTLLSGLAHALGQAAGFSVDLDLDKAITDAVDEVLAVEAQNDAKTLDAVTTCLRSRMLAEEKWDLRPTLIQMVKELYSEKVQMIRDTVAMPTAEHDYTQQLRDYKASPLPYESTPEYQELCALYEKMKDYKQEERIPQGATYYHLINRAGQSIARDVEAKDAFRGLSDSQYASFTKIADRPKQFAGTPEFIVKRYKDDLALGQHIYDDLLRMNELLPLFRQPFARRQACCTYLNELQLLGYVVDRIRFDQRENNTFLLTETANTLCRALKEHDAFFILEKAGIRYEHIMLDEFQDTSTLQWSNFRELVLELLSQGGSALIVGDVKQSIYRWRNGDYEIMQGLDLDPDLQHFYTDKQLVRNFRSCRAIVGFNGDTFRLLSANEAPVVKSMYEEHFDLQQLDKFYKSSKPEGYVCLRRFSPAYKTDQSADQQLTHAEQNEQARTALLDYMFCRMETLLDYGYDKKDMLILCRSKGDSKRVIDRFNQLIADSDTYPHLAAAGKIISRDSFSLSASLAVQTIVSALSYIARHDGVGLQLLKTNYPDIDVTEALRGLHCGLPLNVLVDRIVASFLCTAADNTYDGSDIAHLNCFRDKLRGYVCNHGSDVHEFLRYWDDNMQNDTIPANDTDDIKLMTIHSSKGLQAKNVFIPFCGWKMEETGNKAPTMWCDVDDLQPDATLQMPVPYGAWTEMGMPAEHAEEQLHQRVDALNLLYVACTRAEDNLFVLVYDDAARAGQLLTDLYDVQPNDMVEWGDPMMQRPVAKKEEEEMPEPFSFEKTPTLDAVCATSGAKIEFRQSQQARQLMMDQAEAAAAPDDFAQAEAAQQSYYTRFGTLCHAILEHIRTADDLSRAVEDMWMRGQIPSEAVKKNITDLISRLMQHPVAGEWFTDRWTLLREDTILSRNEQGQIEERRVDRVMISRTNPGQALVLDYKFAREEAEHEEQVRNYMQALRNMGYTDVRGFLWYGFRNYLKEVI